MGYITENKRCTVDFGKEYVSVDGKRLDNATFKRIMRDYETKLGKKVTAVSIYFKGIITEISENNVEMEGQFSTSLSTD